MKKSIDIAVSTTQINVQTKEIDFPECTKYYSKNDDGKFFAEGLILFAIIQKYPDSIQTYNLVRVTRNKQEFNDFCPAKDCKQDYWLKDGSSLRKEALKIISEQKYSHGFTEITKEEFDKSRLELINAFYADL